MVNSNGNGDYAEAEYLRKIFIGGLTSTTTDEGLQQYFEKWGTVVDAVVMKDPKTKKSRGFGFITYSESSMVDAAQKARPHTIDGRTVEAKRAVPREDVGRPEISGNSQKIYVGRLGSEITEDDLREHFGNFGNVTGVNIVKDKEGQSRGFGFVEFDDSDPVDKLVLQKDHEINGKAVDVKKSQPKQKGGDGDNSRQGGGRNQVNQGGFRGNNAGGNNNWGRNQGNNFSGSAWSQNNSNTGYGGGNSGNNAWSNNSSGNFGNNSGGGFDNNYGGGWNNYSGGNSGNNFGNQGFGGNYGGNSGGNFNNSSSYGSGNQQFGNGGGNFGNSGNKQYNNSGGFKNFSNNGNNFGGGNQVRKGGLGPIRNQNTGNRQRPFGNRNAGAIGGGNFGN